VSFRLPSLALATAYDAPAAPLTLPGVLRRAHYPHLALADGIGVDSDGSVRLAARALLGVRVATQAAWVRVSLRLALDDRARWLRSVAGHEAAFPHLHAVALRAAEPGAAPVGLVLFAPQTPGELTGVLEAVLPVRDGLVTMALAPADPGHDHLVAESPLGLRVDGVAVEPWQAESTGVALSTGRPAVHVTTVPAWSELIALTPLLLPGEPGVRGRVRMVALDLPAASPLLAEPLHYQVVTTGGEVLRRRQAVLRDGALVMPVGRLEAPVYVRVALPAADDVAWQVRFLSGGPAAEG
jgi:hypothetical protein